MFRGFRAWGVLRGLGGLGGFGLRGFGKFRVKGI